MRSHSFYLPVPLPPPEEEVILEPLAPADLADLPVVHAEDDRPLNLIGNMPGVVEGPEEEEVQEEEEIQEDDDEEENDVPVGHGDDDLVFHNQFHIDNEGYVPQNQRYLLGDCSFESNRGKASIRVFSVF